MSNSSRSTRSSESVYKYTILSDQCDTNFDDSLVEKAQAYEAYSNWLIITTYLSNKKIYLQTSAPSALSVRQIFSKAGRIAYFLLPSFFRNEQETRELEAIHPTAYLDGIRGLAAFVVLLCHLSYGTWDITRSYGSGAKGENNWILQLPFLRLLYSGPPMVAIFFVVSGYVLSYKPIRLMRRQDCESLLISTSSSVFRRALRLFLPCFASTFLVACLAQAGIFEFTEDFAASMPHNEELQIKSTEVWFDQFRGWARSMFDFVDIFHWNLYAGTTHFDFHLWTIPAEYRCGLLLFLTHILMARMFTRTRLIILVFLIFWGVQWDKWDMTPFWAGEILAELHHCKASKEAATADAHIKDQAATIRRSLSKLSWICLYILAFILGCFLASFPDEHGHDSPGFIYLNSMIPDYWTEKHRFWPNIGAVLIVWSSGNINWLRKTFTTKLVQYLGKISFPLYVVHGSIIKTVGYMTMQYMYNIIGRETRQQMELGFFLASFITIVFTIWVADLFWRAIDIPCVKFSKWLEGKMFVSRM